MSTAVNMFIKQVIKRDGLPFEVCNPKPNKELLDAIQEGEDIMQELKEGKIKGYNNMKDLIKSLDED